MDNPMTFHKFSIDDNNSYYMNSESSTASSRSNSDYNHTKSDDLFIRFIKKTKFISFIIVSIGFIIGSLLTRHHINSNPHKYLTINKQNFLENSYYKSDFYINNSANLGSNPFDIETTINRLYKFFPYEDIEKGENNILQMWKKRPEDCEYGEFPDGAYKTWINLNPTYNYTFYTNNETKILFNKVFKDTLPEVYEAFHLLPLIILQSDFARYLLLFLYGGTYSDIDVEPYKPISDWLDSYLDTEINTVIGIEQDLNFPNWNHYMPRRVQFLQWTFKAKRRQYVMARLIAKIVKITFEAKFENKLNAFSDEFEGVDRCKAVDVMDWTGPGIFTDTFYEVFNLQNINHANEVIELDINRYNHHEELYGPDPNSNEKISWKLLTGMKVPIVIGDILVLPQWGFNGHENCTDYCYVEHHFSGSWKSSKPEGQV